MRVVVVLVMCPYPQRSVPGMFAATHASSAPRGRGAPGPLSLGKLEGSCFLLVYLSSFLSYAWEDKAEYFLITEERKATRHILGMGKEW